MSPDLTPLNNDCQESIIQTEYSPLINELFILESSSYGQDFFVFLYLLKMSAGAERGVEAHILGLGRIQLAGALKADTRTKLLAVLVWLSNRTTHSAAK